MATWHGVVMLVLIIEKERNVHNIQNANNNELYG